MNRVEFNVTLLDDAWPRLKMIVSTPAGVSTRLKSYDVAATDFEPFVRTALQDAVLFLIKKKKGES
jgi:hypothetical protein